jgi:small-conductance mechanosensitive channel
METIIQFLKDPTVKNWILVFVIWSIIWIAIKLINRNSSKIVKTTSRKYKARKLIIFAGYLGSIIALMVVFNYKFSTIGVTLGVAGAGIAFALQEVIVSIAGYVAIVFGNFFKIGDRIKLGGIKGDVVDIGVLRTTVMEIGDWVNGDLYNGKMVRVANSFIFKEPVFNYSGDFPFIWDEITIPIKFDSDLPWVSEELLKILTVEVADFTKRSKTSWDKLTDELFIENAKIDPMVTIVFDENWVTHTLRYVVDFKSRRITKDKISRDVLALAKVHPDKIKLAVATLDISGSTIKIDK